jgi:hypothetical protein
MVMITEASAAASDRRVLIRFDTGATGRKFIKSPARLKRRDLVGSAVPQCRLRRTMLT